MTQDQTRQEKVRFFELAPKDAGSYFSHLTEALSSIDGDAVQRVFDRLKACATNGGTIYIAGNGGSASVADHASCDLTKGASRPDAAVRCLALTTQSALLSACINDFGSGVALTHIARMFVTPNDVMIVVSSSGNSENICGLAAYCQENSTDTIAFTGFDGGLLASMDLFSHINIPSKSYGVIEDCHMAIIHALADKFWQA